MSLNRLVRRRAFAAALAVAALGPLACKDSTGEDEPRTPAAMQVVAGNGQDGTVGTELPDPVIVRVVDAQNRPVRGQLVNFRVTSGGGSVFSGSALTGADGRAQERWTLGTSTAQPQRLEARAVDQGSGAPLVFGTFEATAKPGPADRIEATDGTGQEGTAGQALALPLVATVFDEHGNPVPDVTVSWETFSAGTLAPAGSQTNEQGRATTVWTLGAAAGPQTAIATVTGLSAASFQATAGAGAPAALEIVGPGALSATVATASAEPLVVRVRDAHGNTVSGVAVQWTVVSGGATLGGTETITGDAGTAANTVTMGTVAGEVRIRAAVDGVSAVEFVGAAVAGPVTRLESTAGVAQTVVVQTRAADSLEIRAFDRYDNPVGGAAIIWVVLSGGGSLSPTTSVTNATGIARTAWTAGPNEGTGTARATAGAVASSVFTMQAIVAFRWARVTLPTTAVLRDIWGFAANDVYVVGEGGTLLHFDGTAWTRIETGTTATIGDVWGSSPTDVYAGGLHYDGTSWTPYSPPTGTVPRPAGLKDGTGGPNMSVRSATDAMAIILGFGGDTIKHWNGTAWTTQLVTVGGANAVWMSRDGKALVGMSNVGGGGSGYWYDGTVWRQGLGGGRAFGYVGKSFNNVFIRMNELGSCCHFAHSDGTRWDYDPGGSFQGMPLWFVSPNEVYYLEGSRVRRLTGGAQFNGAGVDEGISATKMWSASSAELYLIDLQGALWKRIP